MKATHLKISQRTNQTRWTTNKYEWRLHLSTFLHPGFTSSITIPHKNHLLSCAPSSGEGKGEHLGGWSLHPYLSTNQLFTSYFNTNSKYNNLHPYYPIDQPFTSKRWRSEGKKQENTWRVRARGKTGRKEENKGGFERKSASLIQKSYNKTTQEHVITIQREMTTFAIETISNTIFRHTTLCANKKILLKSTNAYEV